MTSLAQAIIDSATTQLGLPYTFGAEQPGVTMDCSGLTQWVAEQQGISIPRTSEAQWSALPHDSGPAPGEFVYSEPGEQGPGPGHVGIVINSTEDIEATHTGAFVSVEPLPTGSNLVGYASIGPNLGTATFKGGAGGGADAATPTNNVAARSPLGGSGSVLQEIDALLNPSGGGFLTQLTTLGASDAVAAVRMLAFRSTFALAFVYIAYLGVKALTSPGESNSGGPSVTDFINNERNRQVRSNATQVQSLNADTAAKAEARKTASNNVVPAAEEAAEVGV